MLRVPRNHATGSLRSCVRRCVACGFEAFAFRRVETRIIRLRCNIGKIGVASVASYIKLRHRRIVNHADTGLLSRTKATLIVHSGCRAANSRVPSRGSTRKYKFPLRVADPELDLSSAITGIPGSISARASRIISSAIRSADVTGEPSAFNFDFCPIREAPPDFNARAHDCWKQSVCEYRFHISGHWYPRLSLRVWVFNQGGAHTSSKEYISSAVTL